MRTEFSYWIEYADLSHEASTDAYLPIWERTRLSSIQTENIATRDRSSRRARTDYQLLRPSKRASREEPHSWIGPTHAAVLGQQLSAREDECGRNTCETKDDSAVSDQFAYHDPSPCLASWQGQSSRSRRESIQFEQRCGTSAGASGSY